jgi:hypothetical protein
MKPGEQRSLTTDDRAPYVIKLHGEVDPRWVTWFDGMTAKEDTGDEPGLTTTLRFAELDQAKLRGILTRLWDLNLIVVSVQRVSPPGAPVVEATAGEA